MDPDTQWQRTEEKGREARRTRTHGTAEAPSSESSLFCSLLCSAAAAAVLFPRDGRREGTTTRGRGKAGQWRSQGTRRTRDEQSTERQMHTPDRHVVFVSVMTTAAPAIPAAAQCANQTTPMISGHKSRSLFHIRLHALTVDSSRRVSSVTLCSPSLLAFFLLFPLPCLVMVSVRAVLLHCCRWPLWGRRVGRSPPLCVVCCVCVVSLKWRRRSSASRHTRE